ncbi:uncharacterized protein MONBRDRAFT_33200 [Monosiga brevicollis MX1]|uniref:Rhodanese domain-containing protein n=1 Tax=Monosiga brevicollis TaxID=81824 RepID=A9V446_MONBE|nr:uncharacterized protein MONBRDRAFT_33200 [Monosiga brevicollis MX1]EDQ87555.1 predicted protein [Monosiga brevicollis MX1]|eukprot:XP_001747475.1 hypothetical protein [Monosiga brevicollis MX1]
MGDDAKGITGFLVAMPAHVSTEDVGDLVQLAIHYSSITPESIRSQYTNPLFGSGRLRDEQSPARALCFDMSPSAVVNRSSSKSAPLFLVDVRPIDRYDDGHFINTQWHLDSKLMMDDPAAFETELSKMEEALTASDKHICLMGQTAHDGLVDMLVARLLQRHFKYVSLVRGGYVALYEYIESQQALDTMLDGLDLAASIREGVDPLQADPAVVVTQRSLTQRLAGLLKRGPKLQGEHVGEEEKTAAAGDSSPPSVAIADSAPTAQAAKPKQSATDEERPASSWWTEKRQQYAARANTWGSRFKEKSSQYASALSEKSKVIKANLVKNLKSGGGDMYRGGDIHTNFSIDDEDEDEDHSGQARTADAASDPTADDHSMEADVKHALLRRTASGQLIVDVSKLEAAAPQHTIFQCNEVVGDLIYPSWLILTEFHILKLRAIQSSNSVIRAAIMWRRALTSIVRITAKKKYPTLLSFVYQESFDVSNPDNTELRERYLVPQAAEAKSALRDAIARSQQIKTAALMPSSPPPDEAPERVDTTAEAPLVDLDGNSTAAAESAPANKLASSANEAAGSDDLDEIEQELLREIAAEESAQKQAAAPPAATNDLDDLFE